MDVKDTRKLSLGIVGGGQLGKLLAQAAQKLNISVTVLDPSPDCPASNVAKVIIGDYTDVDSVEKLAQSVDFLTYEREDIDVSLLEKIASHCQINPRPEVLKIIQDKLLQKQFLQAHNIPTSPFESCETPSPQQFEQFGYPLVQKARTGGFDGRGVQVLQNKSEFSQALAVSSLIEKCVDIDKELAVMVARSQNGEVVVYPVVEMVLQSGANILDTLQAPAAISEFISRSIQKIAIDLINALKLVGVMGIELFLSKSGELLVNEVSARTHNSGHYTIEACYTSQYEQQLRAIMGLPLGSTQLLSPCVMVNLLGQGVEGPTRISGLGAALAIPGASVHLYGKMDSRPGRKMGHAVILNEDIETAKQLALSLKNQLYISGDQP